MRNLTVYVLVLLFAPLPCFAEQIRLSCANQHSISMVFEVDPVKNDVLFHGIPAIGVYIDKSLIEFSIDTDADEWYIKIDRISGKMTFQDMKSNAIITDILCKQGISK